jgi:quinate dehydrogenase
MAIDSFIEAPTIEQVQQLERHGYLFGQKLTASMSPLFHNTIYRELGLSWGQARLDSLDVDNFLKLIKDPKFYGKSRDWPFFQPTLPSLIFCSPSPPTSN